MTCFDTGELLGRLSRLAELQFQITVEKLNFNFGNSASADLIGRCYFRHAR